jgi:hypothetical protein
MFERLNLWWHNVCYKHRVPKTPDYLNDAMAGPGHHYWGATCELCAEEWRVARAARHQQFLDKQAKAAHIQLTV